ncbi:MAG: transposase [Candidatus Sericytochromatia bacterium]
MNYYNPEKHHRRSIRLRNYDYSSNGAYFITLVTKNREDIFGEIINGEMILNEIGNIVKEEWYKTAETRDNIILDEFIVMPNHFHGIIFIDNNGEGWTGGRMRYAPTEDSTEKHTIFKSTKNHLHMQYDPTEDSTEKHTIFKSTKNHLHMRYDPTEDSTEKHTIFKSPKNNLGSTIRGLKASITKKYWEKLSNCCRYEGDEGKQYETTNIIKKESIWQRNYYEHIIRNEKALNNIRKYIKENPIKWFLDKENEKGDFKKYKFKGIKEINNFEI